MLLVSENNLPLYHFANLSKFGGIKHFVSNRQGGASEGDKDSFNLSYKVNDNPEHVAKNRSLLASSMGIGADKLVFPQQTHKNKVQVVTDATQEIDLAETDGVVTNIKGICLAVMSADCAPVIVYDPVKHVIGASHAGWRGTVGKIAANMVQMMKEVYGSDPADLVAGIGPSISPEVYEVGEEVIEATKNAFGTINGLVKLNPVKEGKGHFNLWEANKRALIEAGVKPGNIEIAEICTFSNSDTFFSHRNNPDTGRFAAGIVLN